MKSRQEFKELFEQLPLSAQTDLLSGWLQGQEAPQEASAQKVREALPTLYKHQSI